MRFGRYFLLPILALSFSTIASANLSVCADAKCGWQLNAYSESGKLVATDTGGLKIDASGNITLTGDGSVATNTGVAAGVALKDSNIDPALGFSFAAINNSDDAATFAFSFAVPISVVGPIAATASANYNISTTNPTGGSLFLTSQAHLIVSQDTDLDLLIPQSINKGVDLGEACTTAAPGLFHCGASPISYTAGPAIIGVPGTSYELMSATVVFGLTAKSSVGGSVFINQTAVPEPSSYALLLAGIGMAGCIARRRLVS
jgi:hypothetical protein